MKVTKQGNVTVVTFGQEHRHLAEIGLEEISNQLVEIADQADPPHVLLDMKLTEFFGSSFIEVLFRIWKRLNLRSNPKFAISGLRDYCREVLAVTHLDRIWPLYANVDEGVKEMSAN